MWKTILLSVVQQQKQILMIDMKQTSVIGKLYWIDCVNLKSKNLK